MIKGHSDILGNELAYHWAKFASNNNSPVHPLQYTIPNPIEYEIPNLSTRILKYLEIPEESIQVDVPAFTAKLEEQLQV